MYNLAQHEYFLHNQNLTSTIKANYLGITFDTDLNFNYHVDSVCQKANQFFSFFT